MKRVPLFFMTLLFPFIVQGAEPTPSAPKMINLQAVLVDDGGNVLYDKQEADIVFSVIDGDGETLYEEVQHVPIVNGAISVLIGKGKDVATGETTGGIPMEALLPDGSKLLRIKLNEQSIPQEDLQLVSVPYALYAESLSHPIESDEILDGTLVQADLSSELVASLENSMSTLNTNSLTSHRTESGAHPARSISVENNFTHASGTDLQTVLSGLDSAIGARRNQEGELIEDVGDEIVARAAGDDDVRASEISRAGDTIYGDLTFYTDDTLATQTMSIAPTTGDITTQGQVSALGGMFTIELDPATSEPIVSIDNAGGVETYRFEAETGSLTLLGDLTVADADILMSPGRLVDGVDISALNLRVGDIEIRLPPGGTPLDDIYVNETGDTMTGPLTATAFSGDGSALTALNGSNITSGTVADGRIASTITRDSELSDHADDTSDVHGVGAGNVVGTTLPQTLTNKTLTSPNLSSPTVTNNTIVSGHGDSWTLRDVDATQEIVGTSASQTLSGKTLSTPTIQGATFQKANGEALPIDLDYSDDLTTGTHFDTDVSSVITTQADGIHVALNLGTGVVGTNEVANGSLTSRDLAPGTDPDDGGPEISLDDRYVNAEGDETKNGSLALNDNLTMSTSNIAMEDPAGCTPGTNCNTVDGVDVSHLKTRVDSLAAPLAEPSIIAWGRVTLDGPNDDSPNITGDNVSSVDAGDINASFGFVDTTNQGTYRVNLAPAISGTYIVVGNVTYTGVGNPRGPLVVISQSSSSFVVRTMSTASDPDGDVGFNFSIINTP